MKRFALLLACLFGLMASAIRAEEEISFDFFYDALAPMGEWAEVEGYGYVWHPADVDAEWAPYTDGYWSYTDAGWTWVSYEDWGGITYHYGRWVQIEDYGWCWVPEYEWGPAWVSWRQSDDYVGWAPLPPEATWEQDRGIGEWVDTSYDIGPDYFSFCHVRDFGAPVLRHVLVPRSRNLTICFETRNITRISYNSDYGCVFNGGIDYDTIVRRCDRPIPALKLVFNTTNVFVRGDRHNIFLNGPRGNALVIGRPHRAERDFDRFTRRDLVKKTFEKNRVVRGWGGHNDRDGRAGNGDKDLAGQRARLLAKMREQTKGLTPKNSPVRHVREAALTQALPKEADFKARPAALQNRQKPGNGGLNPNDPRRTGPNDRGNRPDVVNKRPGSEDNQPDGRNPRSRPGTDRDPATPGENRPGRGPGRAVTKPDDAPNTPDRNPGTVDKFPGKPGRGNPAGRPDNDPTPGVPNPNRGNPAGRPGQNDNPREVERPGKDSTPGNPAPNRGNPGRGPRANGADPTPDNDGRERNGLNKVRPGRADTNPAADQENAGRRQAAQAEAARRQAEAAREKSAEANQKRGAEMQEKQAEAARQRAAEANRGRAAEANRERANANANANAQRQQQAEAARERANANANAQRQQQAESAARERANANANAQRQQQAEAARERGNAQRQQQAQAARENAANAQKQQQQQTAARQQAEANKRSADKKDDDDKKKRGR